jgi:hypothetical protein
MPLRNDREFATRLAKSTKCPRSINSPRTRVGKCMEIETGFHFRRPGQRNPKEVKIGPGCRTEPMNAAAHFGAPARPGGYPI